VATVELRWKEDHTSYMFNVDSTVFLGTEKAILNHILKLHSDINVWMSGNMPWELDEETTPITGWTNKGLCWHKFVYICTCKNPIVHERSKHIEMMYYIEQQFKENNLKLVYCKTKDQIMIHNWVWPNKF